MFRKQSDEQDQESSAPRKSKSVRVLPAIWRAFKAACARKDVTMQEGIEDAMKTWAESDQD